MTAPQLIQRAVSAAQHNAQNILCVDADDYARLLIAELLYEHDVDFALTADDAVQLAHSRTCFVPTPAGECCPRTPAGAWPFRRS